MWIDLTESERHRVAVSPANHKRVFKLVSLLGLLIGWALLSSTQRRRLYSGLIPSPVQSESHIDSDGGKRFQKSLVEHEPFFDGSWTTAN